MTKKQHRNLLKQIEAFMKLNGVSASRFGEEAAYDRHFVFALRDGCRHWGEEKLERINLYLRFYTR